jgi:hypothetical protein
MKKFLGFITLAAARVYHGGSIHQMNKQDFKARFSSKMAA